MPSNCIYSNLKTFLRELKRDTVLTNIGTILFADGVRATWNGINLYRCTLSTFMKADRMKYIGKSILEFSHPSMLCSI